MLTRFPCLLRPYSTFSLTKPATNKMSLNMLEDYEAAILKLNTLQSNSHYIQKYGMKSKENQDKYNSAHVTRTYLERSGISLEQLDKLSVIHVAGTKGKGTTCAFSESILRHHGYKTGFFSSPHLLEVRERIRINGIPISRESFVSYFWKIHNQLDAKKENETDMPLYFGFMTVMAFHMFVDQKVDVAIIEVGIGGRYDCTNALRKIDVACITSLGIDHTSLLGDTIESIAWNKAGIIKPGAKTFTVPQVDEAMQVLKDESIKQHSPLIVVEPKSKYLNENKLECDIINLNANLALSICEEWIHGSGNNNNNGNIFSKEMAQTAINNCLWPGRFEIRRKNKIWYYLDGAHTVESITLCSNWFKEKTANSKSKKVLMFNLTGDRDSEKILGILHRELFDVVCFVPNQLRNDNKADNTYYSNTTDKQIVRCEAHKDKWLELNRLRANATDVRVFGSVSDAIDQLDGGVEYDLLVTGSLHLIGAVLGVLDPDLKGTLI